jgi:hypothetical protein
VRVEVRFGPIEPENPSVTSPGEFTHEKLASPVSGEVPPRAKPLKILSLASKQAPGAVRADTAKDWPLVATVQAKACAGAGPPEKRDRIAPAAKVVANRILRTDMYLQFFEIDDEPALPVRGEGDQSPDPP